MCGERTAAFIGTAAYMLVPYRLLDLYLRAAVGEYTAMAFLPVVIYGLYLIYTKRGEKGGSGWLWLAFGFSGLIQCHVISTFIAGLFTFLVCVVKIRETLQKEVLLQFVKAAVCTVLLNLWFLLPFLDYMQFEYKMSEPWERFTAHGAFLSQLVSFFPHGNGASIATGMLWDTDSGIEMPYTLGGGIMLALVLCAAYGIYEGKGRRKIHGYSVTVLGIGFCILSLYMSTLWFPWDFLQQKSSLAAWIIGSIQYPWRFLAVSSVAGAFVTAFTVHGLKGRGLLRQAAIISIGILALVSAVYFMQDYVRCGEIEDFTGDTVWSWSLGREEYMPAGADESTFAEEDGLFQGGEGLGIESYERGDGTVSVTCENGGGTEAYLDVPILHYKGYAARDSGTGERLTVMPAENQRVRVMIPAGYKGTFRVKFEPPWYWRVSEAVSLAAAVLLFGFLVYRKHIGIWQKAGSGLSGSEDWEKG